MARIRPTVPVFGKFFHREHRSRKGRKKFIITQSKTEKYFIKKKSDNERMEIKRIRIPHIDHSRDLEESYRIHDGLEHPSPAKKSVQKESFPKLVCENCGYINQLRFDPLVTPSRLSNIFCSRCLQNAYWMSYFFRVSDIFQFFSSNFYAVRLAIKQGKITLSDIYSSETPSHSNS